jgi:hypothetical protein
MTATAQKSEFSESNGFSFFNEFCYILVKNFEAKKIDSNLAIATFLDKINEMKESISLNETFEILFNSFITVLSVTSESDVAKIENFLKSLFQMLNNDWYSIEKKLIQMFSSIKIYKEMEEIKLKKKLVKVK